jgi:phage terminase small subunit
MSTDPLCNLSVRKRLYVQGLVDGKTKKQAAIDAGYSPSFARAAGTNIETKDVQQAFRHLLRTRIPAHKIAKRIAEGLDAVETKFFQKDGVVTDSKDVVAWSERRQYAELASEFGGYVARNQDVSQTNVGIKVIVEHIGSPPNPVTAETERIRAAVE